MKKLLTAALLSFCTAFAAFAQNAITLPIAAQAVADIGNGPIKVRMISGNASIFTAQGSGTGSTAGSSTSLTLTGTPATPPKVGALISGTGIASGTTVAAYNGTTGVTLSAAMTVAGGTAVAWGASCPASAAGIPAKFIQASVMADYYLLYTQARVCAVSPGGPVNTLLILPIFYDQQTPGSGTFTANDPLIGTGTSSPNIGQGTRTGNTTQFATWLGATTSGQCVSMGADGNLQLSGATCGAGSQIAATQNFLTGAGFTPGVTTTLTLSSAPTNANFLLVAFDGIVRSHNTYSLVGSVITFLDPIPVNTLVVETQWYAATTTSGVVSINGISGSPVAIAGGAGISIGTAGTTVTVSNSGRITLLATTTFYVATTGNDTNNNCLVQLSPCATIQRAANVVKTQYDLGNFGAIIQIAPGTYTQGTVVTGTFVGSNGTPTVVFQGTVGNAADVVVHTTNEVGFWGQEGALFTVQWLTVKSTTSGDCIFADWPGTLISINAIIFDACAQNHMHASDKAAIVANLIPYSIVGGAQTHMTVDSGALINTIDATVGVVGSPVFIVFAVASGLSMISAGGTTYSSGAVGQRYNSVANSVIDVGGGGANFFPGNSAGTTSTGGLYQ